MRKNFLKVIMSILFLVFCAFSFNYYLDAYAIFGKNLKYQTLEPNQNYIKTKYILESQNKFDGFIFGSSRIGYIPTEKIKNYKIYSMGYSEGLPQEWKETLEIFIKNNIIPKIVILGIDDFDFKVSPRTHEKQQMRKPYYLVNRYRDYILIPPFSKYNFIKLKNIILNKKDKNFEIELKKDGRLFKSQRIERENEINSNKREHLKNRIFQENNAYTELENKEKTKVLENLKIIDEMCKKNNIKLIFIFNPVHPRAYKNNYARIEYREIREEIKKIFKNIPIYDFAEMNIINDNLFWFETSHFNTKVGEMMLEQISEIEL